MRLKHRCLVVFLCLALCFCMAVPSYATLGDAVSYSAHSFSDWVTGIVDAATGSDFTLSEFWQQLTNQTTTDSDSGEVVPVSVDDAYIDFVSSLRDAVGSSVITNNGLRIYASGVLYTNSSVTYDGTYSLGNINSFIGALTCYSNKFAGFSSSSLTAPFHANVTGGVVYDTDYCNFDPSVSNTSYSSSCASGATISASALNFYVRPVSNGSLCSFSCSFYFDFVPYTGVLEDYYDYDLSSNRRVSTLTQNLPSASFAIGAVEDGAVVNVYDSCVFNEEAETFTDPATGTVYNITNWNYDYSTRTYNCTSDAGDPLSVAYGDDNCTVVVPSEGDTFVTNNYYYVTENADSGDDSGETIWDKLGTLLGAPLRAIFGVIESVLSRLLDGLISLVDMLSEKVVAVFEKVLSILDGIPELFGGFLDFLGSMFAWLPEDIVMLIEFGLIASIFVGLIMFFKR